MAKVRVSASMSMQIAEERAFVEQWKKSLPRRRQQWLREQIYLGVGSGAKVISYRSSNDEVLDESSSNIVRLQIELDDRDPEDQKSIDIYSSMSKTRRGQWLRNVLILGNRISTKSSGRLVNVSTLFVTMGEKGDRVSQGVEPKVQSGKTVKSDVAAPPENEIPPTTQLTEISIKANNSPAAPEKSAEKPLHASALRGLFTA